MASQSPAARRAVPIEEHPIPFSTNLNEAIQCIAKGGTVSHTPEHGCQIKFLCTTYITSQRIVFWPRYPDQIPSRVIALDLGDVEDEQLIAPMIGPDKIRFRAAGATAHEDQGVYKLKFRNDITTEVLIQLVKMLCKRRFLAGLVCGGPAAGPVDVEALQDGASLEIAAAASAMALRFSGPRPYSPLEPLPAARPSASASAGLLTPPRTSASASSGCATPERRLTPVPGPEPGGAKRAFLDNATGRIYLTEYVAAGEEPSPLGRTSRPYDGEDLRRSVALLKLLNDRKLAGAAKRRPPAPPRPAPPALAPGPAPPPPAPPAPRLSVQAGDGRAAPGLFPALAPFSRPRTQSV